MISQNVSKEIEHFQKNDWYRIEADELDDDSVKHYVADLVKKTKIGKGQRVLEIACGGGQFGLRLVKKTQVDYIGLDLIDVLVKDANRRARKEKVNAQFIEGDAHQLPFPDGSFDLVVVTYSLHHFPPKSLEKVVGEAHRVLKKGGVFYILEPNGLNPIMFKWWLINSPERILPLGKKWRENRDLSANETIIYPWTVSNALSGKFPRVKVFGQGFFPKRLTLFKKNPQFWVKMEEVLEKIPLLNKFGGSFIVLGYKE